MVETYGGKTIVWGYNETPVVDGDVIYCTPGGADHSVMALNRHNGSEIWSCPGKGEYSAYCTPLLFTHNGRKILTTHTESHLLGIDAKTGTLLWAQPQPNKYSVHANTPLYHDGGLFYFSGYGKGSGKLNLNEDGSKIDFAWENISMDGRMGGAVLLDGYIYGSGDNNREWKCIDWKTGENKWESKEIAKGNIIYADGKLYCYSEKGELAILEATPEKFNLLSQTKVEAGTEQHWAHIMISKDVLYLRHGDALVAYKIK
jgi:outer membrane protein assembly factor BamB